MSECPGFSLFFGAWKVPLDITLLAVNDRGQTVGAAQPEFNFHFRYRGHTFNVKFRDQGETANMDLHAWMGSLPYTAESGPRRQALRAILSGANQDLGPLFTVTRGKIGLRHMLDLPVPVTAVGLITALSKFLLPLKPYLDLMDMVRLMPKKN
jgi:hypothetical protein